MGIHVSISISANQRRGRESGRWALGWSRGSVAKRLVEARRGRAGGGLGKRIKKTKISAASGHMSGIIFRK
ncbi:hypothetical protein chiPu_0012101 [Chiloscyllium punctatum]|uniref:Uncharacterized protein n=1 Tax=Chiloscyllium punctatum TaxID=137246 RepID=A0A401STB4_CHIPU|nr:hypothetical protein [Chiloscyllium punctatum]